MFGLPIAKKDFRRLKNYILRRVGEDKDAEEIFQETLASAIQSLPTFSGKSSFFTWLCGIANHEIADFYRKKKIKTFLFSRFPFLETLVSEALGPEEELLKQELREEVKQVLGSMSEGYSQILRLKYYQGLSMKEIAKKLGMTAKAVESRLSRARAAFKQEWQTQNLKLKN
ncbi:MAG TPA: sigma-70 family RNA polymerase sigma factor [Clostridia bacterium]|nr:sigma-70 family RNA polymerase sigma factor [Clostridia bacterium]